MEITSLSGTFNRVAADGPLRYVSGGEGLVVLHIDNLQELAYAAVSGINDIAVGDSRVFLATNSGVLYFNKKPDWTYEDFVNDIYFHTRYPDLITDEVLSIDCLGDFKILAGTTSGVSFIDGEKISSSAEFSDVRAVKLSISGSLYYGGDFGLAAKRTTVTGSWVADYVLTDSTIPPVFPVNSIDLTQEGGKTVIGIATDQGVEIIKEEGIVGNSSIIQLTI